MLLNPYVYTAGTGIGGGVSYFFSERFEGTGYDNSNANGWVESGTGTVNEDYTALVMEGLHQCRFQAVGGQNPLVTCTLPSDQGELWVFFRIWIGTALNTSRPIFQLRNSSAVQVFAITLTATVNGLQVAAGSANSTVTTDKLNTANSWYVWGHFLKGTGANAAGSCGFSSSGTEVTSGNAFTSTVSGNATTNAHELRLGMNSNTTGDFSLDQILISTTGTIGNSPA